MHVFIRNSCGTEKFRVVQLPNSQNVGWNNIGRVLENGVFPHGFGREMSCGTTFSVWLAVAWNSRVERVSSSFCSFSVESIALRRTLLPRTPNRTAPISLRFTLLGRRKGRRSGAAFSRFSARVAALFLLWPSLFIFFQLSPFPLQFGPNMFHLQK